MNDNSSIVKIKKKTHLLFCIKTMSKGENSSPAPNINVLLFLDIHRIHSINIHILIKFTLKY